MFGELENSKVPFLGNRKTVLVVEEAPEFFFTLGCPTVLLGVQ